MRFKVYTWPCILLLFLACSCFRDIERSAASIAPTPSFSETLARALASSYFQEKEEGLDNWWEVFKNEELNRLIETALANSPTLKAAESKVVAAQATAKVVRSSLFPNLSATADDNWSYLSKYGFFRDFFPSSPSFEIPHKFNLIDLSLNFSYEFDFWGKNRKQVAEALGFALSTQMEKKQAELVLCTAVAFTYFQWQAHAAEKALYEKWLNSEKSLNDFYTSRYEAGIENTIPPLKQSQQVQAVQQKMVDLRKSMQIDALFLKNLLGEGPDSVLTLTASPEILMQKIEIPTEIELNFLAKRPDLMAQIWKVSAAAHAIGVAKTEFYPNINLKALAGLSSLDFSNLFTWDNRTGSLAPAIYLPLFTGGRLQGNLKEKAAIFNEEVHLYNQKLFEATKQVASDVTSFLSIAEQLILQESSVGLQKQVLETCSNRYNKGVVNYREVLSSSQELFAQEINAIRLRHSQIMAAICIIKSLGGDMKLETLPPNLYPPRRK